LPPFAGRVMGSGNFSSQFTDKNVGELPPQFISRTQTG